MTSERTFLGSRSGATLRSRERCLDEHVDIAIKYAIRVSDLHASAVVLHYGVGMQDV